MGIHAIESAYRPQEVNGKIELYAQWKICLLVNSPESRPKITCFYLRDSSYLSFLLLHSYFLLLVFAFPNKEHGTKVTGSLRIKKWCCLWNLQPFCVNLIVNTLEAGEEHFCCFTSKNVKADKWRNKKGK